MEKIKKKLLVLNTLKSIMEKEAFAPKFHFQSWKFRKKMKKSGKSQRTSKFSKKLLVNRLLEYFFHKLQAMLEKGAIYVQKHSFSNIYGLRFFFKD